MTRFNNKPVLLIRPDGNEADAAELAAQAIESAIFPLLAISYQPGSGSEELLRAITAGQGWLVLTSKHALNGLVKLLPAGFPTNLKVAAIGQATATAAKEFGAAEVLVASDESAAGLLKMLAKEAKGTALLPVGNLNRPELATRLQELEWRVIAGQTYQNKIVPTRPIGLAEIDSENFSAAIVRSPSAVQALIEFGAETALPLIAAGGITSSHARAAGFKIVKESPSNLAIDFARTCRQLIENLGRE